jgi:hypothetical protein
MKRYLDEHPSKRAFLCNDCGIDVWKAGDWYMAQPEVWKGLGLKWHDNLCLACLDRRLGFKAICTTHIYPASPPWPKSSPELLKRLRAKWVMQ